MNKFNFVILIALLVGLGNFSSDAVAQDRTAEQELREFQQSKKYKKRCERSRKRYGTSQSAGGNAGTEPKVYCRFPPQFPDQCERDAKRRQYVKLLFDVTPDGYVNRIRLVETDNECFIAAAARSVALWKYEESEAGAVDLETSVTFELQR